MTRIARLTDALRGRGKALVVLGAAAAVAGTGTASLATSAHAATARPAALRSSAASAVTAGFGNASRESASVLTAAVVQAQRATESVLQSAAKAPVKVTAAAQHRAAPAKPAAKHTAPAAHAAPAKRAAPTKHAAPKKHAAPARPYQIYDSVTPSQLPAHHEVATYADGAYAASPAQVAGRKVLWIDTNGSDSKANVLDVEPGDATPSMAANWAFQRLHAQPDALARIYTMRSDWSAVRAAVATLPAKMQGHIRWWIADPTGVPHIVPGAQATQWYWGHNYDISTATAQF